MARTIGYALLFIAVFLGVVGFHTAFTYGDGTVDTTGHVVGGDAYNYIIIGVRGIVFMVGSLCCIVAGSACFVCDWLSKIYYSVDDEETEDGVGVSIDDASGNLPRYSHKNGNMRWPLRRILSSKDT